MPKTTRRKKKAPARKVNKPLSRSLRVYQKIAILFVIFSLLLLLAVLYLSVSQAVIRIVPKQQVVSTTIGVEVTPHPNALGQVSGFVFQEEFEDTSVVDIPQDGGDPVESTASGSVTMINETEARMDLVARTRVLSEEGILFRLDEAVSIPAGGSVEAVVSADEPGLSGEIGPSQFTIPGLSESIQSVVYAVSVDPMTGGVTYKRTLTQADIDQAIEDVTQQIVDLSKGSLRDKINSEIFDGEVFVSEVLESSYEAEVGSEVTEFDITIKAKVTAVFFDRDMLAQHAEADLYEQAPKDFTLSTVNHEGFQIELDRVDVDAEQADLELYLDGMAIVSTKSPILDLDRFIGRAPAEVVQLLESSEFVESASVSFTPFWLKRVPTLKDHIRVIVE
jgi:hypothetical protein